MTIKIAASKSPWLFSLMFILTQNLSFPFQWPSCRRWDLRGGGVDHRPSLRVWAAGRSKGRYGRGDQILPDLLWHLPLLHVFVVGPQGWLWCRWVNLCWSSFKLFVLVFFLNSYSDCCLNFTPLPFFFLSVPSSACPFPGCPGGGSLRDQMVPLDPRCGQLVSSFLFMWASVWSAPTSSSSSSSLLFLYLNILNMPRLCFC